MLNLYSTSTRKRERKSGIRQPTTPWAYEMQIEDPHGNVLRLGVGA